MFVVVALMSVNTAVAQKIGHLSADQIVLQMPAYKSATTQLETLAKQLETQLKNEEDAIRSKVAKAEQNASNLTPAEIQKIEAELQADQQKLYTSQGKYKQQLLEKEQELTAPIYDKIKGAIKSVAQENGYSYVMETSMMLFSMDADDITSLVKSKLGI